MHNNSEKKTPETIWVEMSEIRLIGLYFSLIKVYNVDIFDHNLFLT